MRIGMVSEMNDPSEGSLPEHVHHLAREARRLGHRVQILTTAMPDLPSRPLDGFGPDVIRLGRSVPMLGRRGLGRLACGPGLAGRLREVLARERFDVLHIHSPLSPVLPLLALHYATCPVVGTFHEGLEPGLLFQLARPTLQRYLDRIDAPVATSRALLAPLRGQLQADFQVIPHGVDADRFSRGRRLRRYDDGQVNLLWVGRAEPRAGLDRMLAAFERVWREVDARLIVVGGGPLLPRYRAMVPAALAADVIFAGEVLESRPDWYATADICCVPARAGDAGLAILEAMAAGKPVVASDLPGHRELLHPSREGELVDPEDTTAWVRSIVRLAREPVRAASYGERGRQTAALYAWPSVAREMLSLYRTVARA
jgi:phosphatidylinositol alpha-mannosyltransferase